MFIVDNCIVSEEIADIKFLCNLKKCRGICCKEGDAGAPLEEDEIGVLEDIYEIIEPYMSDEGRIAVQENGDIFDYDIEGNFVTPLIEGQECAFAVIEDDVIQCAIEKAWKDGLIDFRKPISCHLYPIRISNYNEFNALNYHHWSICKDALRKGDAEGVPLYKFLKEPLIRKFGKDWYNELESQIQKQ